MLMCSETIFKLEIATRLYFSSQLMALMVMTDAFSIALTFMLPNGFSYSVTASSVRLFVCRSICVFFPSYHRIHRNWNIAFNVELIDKFGKPKVKTLTFIF